VVGEDVVWVCMDVYDRGVYFFCVFLCASVGLCACLITWGIVGNMMFIL